MKTVAIVRVRLGVPFLYLADAGKSWSLLQHGAELGQLFGRPSGQHFHAAIKAISDVPVDSQFLRGALREHAEPNALHEP